MNSKNVIQKHQSLLKYLVTGGLAFSLEYVSFVGAYKILLLPLFVANSASFMIGLIVSFTINRLWSFKLGDYAHGKTKQTILYLSLAAINLGLINGVLALLHAFGINALIGKIVSMIFIVVWNYLIFNRIIFKRSPDVKLTV